MRSPLRDRVLDDALATVGHNDGRKPQSVVAAVDERTRLRLYERLAEAGLLHPEEDRILGMFRPTGGPQITPTTRRRSEPASSRPCEPA